MVMKSKINECVKQADGTRVSLRIIVNQTMNDEVYNVYKAEMADDNCKSFFETLDIPKFSLNIKIDGVMLLRYDENGVRNGNFKNEIGADLEKHTR
ncbi:hypothetical protein BGZ82_000200 [Podila clonocystis]|nr:hypothetical protein BGZ82_000200 [Podila clonocystis]